MKLQSTTSARFKKGMSVRRVNEILKNCPVTGGGVHQWVFQAACALKNHADESTAFDLIKGSSARCGRDVPDREVWNAISSASLPVTKGATKIPKGLTRNAEQIEAIVRDGDGLAELWESSPIRFDDDTPKTEEIIDQLFPGNPLLCVGESVYKFGTRRREELRGELGDKQHIVPSPMTAREGLTKSGKKSAHTLDNTGTRNFLVVEFDEGPFDQHAAVLVHLAQLAPLVMTMMSGGKSIHGWFHVERSSEKLQLRFMHYAVRLGADPKLWLKSQFARMPDGFRVDKGKLQSVIFLNPANLGR